MAEIQSRTFDDRAEWLAARGTNIGGSEAAAAIGQSPWCSPLELWSRKTGRQDDIESTEKMEIATRLEPVVRDLYTDKFDDRTFLAEGNTDKQQVLYTNSDYPFAVATPDGRVLVDSRDDVGLGEIKCPGLRMAAEWDDEPPLHYQIQVQHNMAVSGRTWGSFACLLGGERLVVFDVMRNDNFVDAMMEREHEFARCIKTDTPPEVDGSESSARALKAIYSEVAQDSMCEFDASMTEWHEMLERAKALAKDAKAMETEAKNRIIAALGSNELGLLVDGGGYTYKEQTRKEVIQPASTFRVLRYKKSL